MDVVDANGCVYFVLICVWQFFFAKSLLTKGRWVKGRQLRLAIFFFFAKSLFNKGRWVIGRHLRLAFFFLQNSF